MRQARASARPCCSPIAACPARRSCRSRPTGGRASAIALDLLPELDADSVADRAQAHRPEGRAANRPRRDPAHAPGAALAAAHLPTGAMADIPDRALGAFAGAAEALARSARPATEGYAKAEVTLGGIDTARLSSKTMEARNVPGLYSSARRSTSPAGSAAIISSGPGRAAGRPVRHSSEINGRVRRAAATAGTQEGQRRR